MLCPFNKNGCQVHVAVLYVTVLEHQIRILVIFLKAVVFLKDHVTLKTGVMAGYNLVIARCN